MSGFAWSDFQHRRMPQFDACQLFYHNFWINIALGVIVTPIISSYSAEGKELWSTWIKMFRNDEDPRSNVNKLNPNYWLTDDLYGISHICGELMINLHKEKILIVICVVNSYSNNFQDAIQQHFCSAPNNYTQMSLGWRRCIASGLYESVSTALNA